MRRRPTILALLSVMALALAPGAVLGQEADTSPAPSPALVPEASPSASPGAPGGLVSIDLVAADIAFDQEVIEVPAGSMVELTLVNRDAVPHDFSLYESEAAAEALFAGETFSGPDAEMTYTFQAPNEPGEYFFRCDVHPQAMTGTFIVTPAAEASPALDASPAATGAVDVGLVEFDIQMPEQLPAGETTFQVTNSGSIEHNFEIEGQGIEREFEEDLQSGETQSMTVDLEPGTYTIYCPVGDHRELGMELELTVTG